LKFTNRSELVGYKFTHLIIAGESNSFNIVASILNYLQTGCYATIFS